MSDCVIYHNPRCGKSRDTLKLLREHGHEPQVIEYLQTPPDAATLDALLQALKLEPAAIVRRGEARYKELGLGEKTLSRAEWLAVLAANPILLERPIVLRGQQARLGRPPEQVLDLF